MDIILHRGDLRESSRSRPCSAVAFDDLDERSAAVVRAGGRGRFEEGSGPTLNYTMVYPPKDEPVMIDQHDDLGLTLPIPIGFLETMSSIDQLRSDAQAEKDACDYDPVGYAVRRVAAMRKHADALEMDMERRMGWVRRPV